jgi:acid phosphatase type 7
MRSPQRAYLFILLLPTASCFPSVDVTPPPADAPAQQVALAGASVMVGAGDIAQCDSRGDELTAVLVDSIMKADSAAGVEDMVFTLGDNAYPSGRARDFAQCWGPSWGDAAKRIMKSIRPTPGNHEHITDWAAPYYKYFGDRAGSPRKGYYAYDVGEWRVIALNSVIAVNSGVPPADRKGQEEWLAKELASNKKLCTLAYWHHPRFSSGGHGSDPRVEPLWKTLYDAKVDLALVGHDHHYERFLPQGPQARLDTLRGIPQILVGTGGAELRGIRSRRAANSAARIEGHFGVLKLTLGAGEYRSAFIDVTGRVWDRSGGKCH